MNSSEDIFTWFRHLTRLTGTSRPTWHEPYFEFLYINKIDGKVHFSQEPIYRHAEGSTYLQPDLCTSQTHSANKWDRNEHQLTSFEVLSRSTTVYDRTTKADACLTLEVRELWLVDPVSMTIEVRHRGGVDETPSWRSSNTQSASTLTAYSPVGKFQLTKSSRISSERNQFRPCSVALDV